MGALIERKIVLTGVVGFPTQIYFKIIGLLKNRGYTVKKYQDWIEINPRSNLYQEMMRKRQAIEQNVARILSTISDMRRDIELIKHDLRKFEQVLEHFEKNKLDTLKSDFVDLVDSQTPTAMHKLVASGKFPTLVYDFFKIEKEEDIDKLKISESEKGLLRIKWMLFQEWMEKYRKAVKERVDMLREELNNRIASLESNKKLVEPYLKAIYKLKVGESKYSGLDDPTIIEGYNTIVSGVELYCWKPVSTKNVKKGKYYSYLDIEIRKKTISAGGSEKETMEIDIKVYVKTKKEIEEIEESIKKKEELMWLEIEQFKGKSPEEEKEVEEKKGRFDKIDSFLKKILSSKEGEPKEVAAAVKEEFISLYDDLKDIIGGLKFKRHPI
ncbi:MAG: hypothetical protein J7L45_03395 [Candidatus Aenigmarchaeota archaeon]|nr:hypothetical protein [Candidatus Aenigmarchaeota archaeon]